MSNINNVNNRPVRFVTTENQEVPQKLSATGALVVAEKDYTNSDIANYQPIEAYSYIGIYLGGEHIVSGFGQPTAAVRDTLTYVAYHYASDINSLSTYMTSAYAYTLDYIVASYTSLFNDIVDLNTYVNAAYAYTINYINNTATDIRSEISDLVTYTYNAYAYTLDYVATAYTAMYAYTTYHGENITYLLDNKEYTNFSNTYTISDLYEAILTKPQYEIPSIESYGFAKNIFDLSAYSSKQSFDFDITIGHLDNSLVYDGDIVNTVPAQSQGLIREDDGSLNITRITYGINGQTNQINLENLAKSGNTLSYTFSLQYSTCPSDESLLNVNGIRIAYGEANDGYYEPLASQGIYITYLTGKFNKGNYGYTQLNNNDNCNIYGYYPIVYVYGDNLSSLTAKRISNLYYPAANNQVTVTFDQNLETTYIGVAYPTNYDCTPIKGESYFLSSDAFGESPLDNSTNVFAVHDENVSCVYGTSHVKYNVLYAYQDNNRKFSGIKQYKAKIIHN